MIFVIVVTYNGMKWIDKALSSIPKKYSVVVIDNASSDGTVQFIESKFQDTIVFAEKENLGFGKANNKGIKYALENGAEYMFLLNQDAYIIDEAIDTLVELHTANPEFGILSPMHLNERKTKLDANFAKYVAPEFNPDFFSDHVLDNTLKDIYEVPFVNAAAWLLSKKCIETVGGFDPIFFHYGEDDNYCQRVRYHGLKIGVVPNSKIIHDRDVRFDNVIMMNDKTYDKKLEKSYKVQCANINNPNAIKLLKNRRVKIILLIIYYLIQLNIPRIKTLMREFKLLTKIKSEIISSRKLNIKKGLKYL